MTGDEPAELAERAGLRRSGAGDRMAVRAAAELEGAKRRRETRRPEPKQQAHEPAELAESVGLRRSGAGDRMAVRAAAEFE